ncbi:hypothetical protein DC345_00780 [Paenibacillus taichungensis]|uniref:PLAT domain-containing protein n=1 Tax=Paenibacillus taichungensis TaxID=484184 RepID=A0A329R4B4_9BACL|nr:PLAT/LH2 domain-containing protein [Paenibacillus taichungensis]RAW19350.1 hypothetical protein DC345_00780 [Paenibacillus taichungensis]
MRKKLSIFSSSLLLGSSLLLPASVFADTVDTTSTNVLPSNVDNNQSNVQAAAFVSHWIDIVTADVADAGTDSIIWIKVIGENGTSGEILLANTSSNPFERGQTDQFNFRCEDVGKVKAIALRTDGSGWKAGWKVSSITFDGKAYNVPSGFFGETGPESTVLYPK